MIGDSLLVIPAMTPYDALEDFTSRSAYFPPGSTWYRYNDKLAKKTNWVNGNGHQTINIHSDEIPVYIKSQSIIVTHEVDLENSGSNPVKNTKDLIERSFKLRVYLSGKQELKENKFTDTFFWDDGHSLDTIHGKQYTLRKFTFENYIFKNEAATGHPQKNSQKIGSFIFYNVEGLIVDVLVNGAGIGGGKFRYEDGIVYVDGLNLELNEEFSLEIVKE